MNSVTARLVTALGFTVFAALYALGAARIFVSPMADPTGPRMFPLLLIAAMGVGVVVTIAEWAAMRRAALPDEPTGLGWYPLLPVVIWTLAYALAFERLGYMLATMLYLLGLVFAFHRGHPKINLALAIGFPVGSYLLLETLLSAQLPHGTWLRAVGL